MQELRSTPISKAVCQILIISTALETRIIDEDGTHNKIVTDCVSRAPEKTDRAVETDKRNILKNA